MYEGIPYNGRYLDQVSVDDSAPRAWLQTRLEPMLRTAADRFRPLLLERYGPEAGAQVQYVEAFEMREYGSGLTDEARSHA